MGGNNYTTNDGQATKAADTDLGKVADTTNSTGEAVQNEAKTTVVEHGLTDHEGEE